MANRALKFCAWSGCSELVQGGTRYCEEHAKLSQQQADERRGSAV